MLKVLDIFRVSATADPGSPDRGFLVNHVKIRCHLSLQNSMPAVVFKKPISTKKGTQTVPMTMPKFLKSCSEGMLVIPKTDVTNVKGKKKMET